MTRQDLTSTLLWQPSDERIQAAGLTAFTDWVNTTYKTHLGNYHDLWQWSVEDISRFWQAVWRYYEVDSSAPYSSVLSQPKMPGAEWFTGAKLNMAEYLLKQGDRAEINRTAIFAESECFASQQISWAELREQVVKFSHYLRQAGVKPGDRVVAYIPISIEATVAMLASISIGAVWSSCSPDFGAKSVLERFQQITPKVLITVTAYTYNGKGFNRTQEVNEIIEALPSLEQVIHLPWLDQDKPQPPQQPANGQQVSWQQALDNNATYASFAFEQVDFSHPVWILYTSGTTGMPKGIVHSQGGTLLELIKFAWLHDDLNPQSVKFFYTSAGWTMFNMLIGGFASGSAIVVYDGCPTYPGNDKLWEISERCGVTYFGTSPTYINSLTAADYSPKHHFDLSHINTFAMGGSPVSPENFAWVYQHVGEDIHTFSMSGGTDVATAFVGQASTLPVRAGEIQCACLGVDACAYDDDGNVVVGEDGELVIRQPMPSMPLYFWNDYDNSRYHSSYFDTFPGIWRQGDLAQFTDSGSCFITGRSDSTLNRYGIRIGTSEIYRNVESIEGIADSLIVNVELPGGKFYMPLFIALDEGAEYNDSMQTAIKTNLSKNCSPRHVPDQVIIIEAVPYTLTGKKQEIPVKKLLMGKAAEKSVNLGACANPEAMSYFIEQGHQLVMAHTA